MAKFNPLNYPICLEQPLRTHSDSAWIEHVPFGMAIVDILRPKTLVELGTHVGVSYSSFCQAVKRLELRSRCYAIDTWEGDEQTSFYGPEILADLRAHHDPRYGDFSRLVQSTFDEAVNYFSDGSIDLLHIDGLHTYEAVKHDFETWFPKLSPRAVVIFHDTNVRERDFGVWKFWAEVRQKYPHFEFFHGHGLGVLYVGNEPLTSDVQSFFSMTEQHSNLIRKFFFTLGVRLNRISQIQSLVEQLNETEQRVQALTIQVEEKEQALRNHLAEKEEKEGEIQSFITRLKDKDEAIEEFVIRIREKEKTIQSLTTQSSEREQMLNTKLLEIYGSRGWRFIQFVWRIRLKLLPRDSIREMLARKFVRALRTVRSEGISMFFPKMLTKTKHSIVESGAPVEITPAQVAMQKPANIPIEEAYFESYKKMLLGTKAGSEEDDYVALSNDIINAKDLAVKFIAFYLPQFHPIPENNKWWGPGFTEWTNVTKAVPQFMGHYQPHLPGELGFYDLRLPDVQRRQVELAQRYGIYGFCFYYYWFHGKRLLEHPLNQFMGDSQIDFPFSICWANENWTRRWDGLENDILIAQEHSPESDLAFIEDAAKIFEHPNYIRINGRPILIVYKISQLPDPSQTANRWKEYFHAKGIAEPYLIAAQTFGFLDPRKIGFDAAVEFPPHGSPFEVITNSFQILNPSYEGMIFSYKRTAEHFGSLRMPEYKLFKTVFPSWDNEPRKTGRGHVFANSSPSLYRDWLQKAALATIKNAPPEEQLIFINAWNEWGEGAHLEPDRKYGYAYLQATADAALNLTKSNILKSKKEAVTRFPNVVKRHDTAIILHLFYSDLWTEIQEYLSNLEGKFDLFVSIPLETDISEETIRASYPHAYIFRCRNRGRDVAPFLEIFNEIYPLDYKYLCKIHSKKSAHRAGGEIWRQDMIAKLLGSKQIVAQIKESFDNHSNWGIIAPKDHVIPHTFYWGSNKPIVEDLARRAALPEEETEFSFMAGSMFWFKPEVFYLLTKLDISVQDFPIEDGQLDGTLAHGIERFFGLLAYHSGYQIVEISPEELSVVSDHSHAKRYKFAPAPQPNNSQEKNR